MAALLVLSGFDSGVCLGCRLGDDIVGRGLEVGARAVLARSYQALVLLVMVASAHAAHHLLEVHPLLVAPDLSLEDSSAS